MYTYIRYIHTSYNTLCNSITLHNDIMLHNNIKKCCIMHYDASAATFIMYYTALHITLHFALYCIMHYITLCITLHQVCYIALCVTLRCVLHCIMFVYGCQYVMCDVYGSCVWCVVCVCTMNVVVVCVINYYVLIVSYVKSTPYKYKHKRNCKYINTE